MIHCISLVSAVNSLLSLLLSFIWTPLFLFLVSLAKVLCVCVCRLNQQIRFTDAAYLFKEPALSFIGFYYFLCLCFVYFCSDLYYILSSTHFEIFCYFLLVPLGVKLSCSCDILLASWRKSVLLRTFLLELLLLCPTDYHIFAIICLKVFYFSFDLLDEPLNWFFSSVLFNFHALTFFQFSFCN